MSIDSSISIISIPDGSINATVNQFEICDINKQKCTVKTLDKNINHYASIILLILMHRFSKFM